MWSIKNVLGCKHNVKSCAKFVSLKNVLKKPDRMIPSHLFYQIYLSFFQQNVLRVR